VVSFSAIAADASAGGKPDESTHILVLDRTIFHPQGGGQPSDRGHVVDETNNFQVLAVSARKEDGVIEHRGQLLVCMCVCVCV
jgi:Ser-tRNA(Ala) deacylase AlaX